MDQILTIMLFGMEAACPASSAVLRSGHRQGDLGHIYPSLPAGPRSQIKVLAEGPASWFADNHLLVSIHGDSGERKGKKEVNFLESFLLLRTINSSVDAVVSRPKYPQKPRLQVPPCMSLPLPLQTPTAIR